MKPTMSLLIVALLLIGGQIAFAQTAARTAATKTGVVTMFARDPISQSLCFKDGGAGNVFEDGQTKNRCSDLMFNSYSPDGLTVGIEGGRQGVIVDLGTIEELKSKYRYADTVGSVQGFAAIDVRNGKAVILKDYKTRAFEEVAESKQLFQPPTDDYASTPVKLGHVYLLRITDTHDKAFELLAKVLVVAHVPNESVTVRWHVLSNHETAKL